MFEQLNEALIAASYGALSLSPDVAVLPEVLLPREAQSSDEFTYYEKAPLQVRARACVLVRRAFRGSARMLSVVMRNPLQVGGGLAVAFNIRSGLPPHKRSA